MKSFVLLQAAILDELDAEFGIAELAAEEERNDRRKAYTAQSLQGLRVSHDVEAFHEDRDVILTLEDREILAEGDDVLVNVNIKDDERYKKVFSCYCSNFINKFL